MHSARRLIRCLVVVWLALFILGCAPAITDGRVLKRWFEPAHDDSITYYDAMQHRLVTNYDWTPDSWFVTIGKKCEDGKYRTRTFSVQESVYRQTKIGDWFNAWN